jgi:hypothetical protein
LEERINIAWMSPQMSGEAHDGKAVIAVPRSLDAAFQVGCGIEAREEK